jgi:hypothetical protein
MNKYLVATGTLLAVLGTLNFTGRAEATPLRLEYTVQNSGGGLFDYDFRLSVDNNDGSYVAGQGWRWIIFGDADQSPSPLTNWVGDLSQSSPWISFFSTSSGGHNGPTLSGPGSSVLSYWVPTGVGDFLKWSGTSTADLGQGSLLFSTLAGTLNSGVPADFNVAYRVQSFDSTSVPEPASLLGLLALGVFGTTSLKFSQKKTSQV